MRFKIDWASLMAGSKFTVVALFYFVFEGKFQVQVPRGGGGGGIYLEGRFDEGFLSLRVWRGLFPKFHGNCRKLGNTAPEVILDK